MNERRVVFVTSVTYETPEEHMDVQQAINLRLHRELNRLGIEFACPTQKLYVVGQPRSDRV